MSLGLARVLPVLDGAIRGWLRRGGGADLSSVPRAAADSGVGSGAGADAGVSLRSVELDVCVRDGRCGGGGNGVAVAVAVAV